MTALVILVTGAALARRYYAPWRERTIETALFERSRPAFWWPPSWRQRYEAVEPILHDAAFIAGLKGTPAVRELVPLLAKAIDLSDAGMRRCAAIALQELGPEAALAKETLVKSIDDKDDVVALMSVLACGEIGPQAEDAVPALGRYLREKEHGLSRGLAARSLGKIGPCAVPVLLEAIHDESEQVQWSVIQALGDIGPEAAIPALLELLGSPNSRDRLRAAMSLSLIKRKQNPDRVSSAV